MSPIFTGLFTNSNDVFHWAKVYGKTGLYFAKISDFDPQFEPNIIYFWLNDSIPYFAIWIFPRRKLKMISLNATYLNSSIPYEKGQLLYTSIDEFCSRTIAVSHPATEWLLFNQELWNTKV